MAPYGTCLWAIRPDWAMQMRHVIYGDVYAFDSILPLHLFGEDKEQLAPVVCS